MFAGYWLRLWRGFATPLLIWCFMGVVCYTGCAVYIYENFHGKKDLRDTMFLLTL